MDTNLLLSWLGLPPGPWPPDDRALLALGPAPASPDQVELRALEQMEKLRPHQLVHPDLVTEGMNRLAQAMIALTTAAAATLTPPATASTPDHPDSFPDLSLEARPAASKPKRPRRPNRPSKPPPAPEPEPVFDAEPLATEPVAPKSHEFTAEPPPAELIRAEIPALLPGKPVRPNWSAADRRDRKRGYATLARVRKLLRGMEAIRPFVADPGEAILTPARVFEYVRATREFRAELYRGPNPRWPVLHGRRVATIVGHPLSLALFRSLVASQRATLAADWAIASEELREGYKLLRSSLNETKRRRALASEWLAARTWFRENPEWVLGLVGGVAFVIAIIRSVAKVSP